jgi:Protein of unknown function (DUF3604)
VELKKNRVGVPENMNTIVVGGETHWTAHDAKYFKVKMPKEVSMIAQDRAYTSPIWYTP